MASLILSTIAFFASGFFINRYLDSIDAPKGSTRSILKFCAALLVAYAVAFVVDRIVG
ncbi:MAG: hypothetical protein ABI790_09465 [Betaproteobacteria bacterium]